MTDERIGRTPEEVAEGIEERKNRERVRMWRARQRLMGSTVVGLFGIFKMATVAGPVAPDMGVLGLGVSGAEVFWVVVVLVAFGVATFDQALKAIGRGS